MNPVINSITIATAITIYQMIFDKFDLNKSSKENDSPILPDDVPAPTIVNFAPTSYVISLASIEENDELLQLTYTPSP
jgi:hypothetical protein